MSKHSIKWIKETRRSSRHVLFIGRPASTLANHLYEASGQCYLVSVSLHADSGLISACTPYDCYVLDADYLGDVTEAMNNILSVHPDARILVISDSFDWEDATNAFRLGAINVVRTPQTSIITRETIKYAMNQQLPRRQPGNVSV